MRDLVDGRAKTVLAERLATWMNVVVEKGRISEVQGLDAVESDEDLDPDADICAAPPRLEAASQNQ